MSREEKQKYLRDSILNDKMDTESFINFMEEDKNKGADLDRYTFDEVKLKVKEFKNAFPERKSSADRGELLQNIKLPEEPKLKPAPQKPVPTLAAKPQPTKELEGSPGGPKKKDADKALASPRDEDDEVDGNRKLDADDDLDKDSKYYGRKDCVKLDVTELVTEESVTVTIQDLSKLKSGAPKGDSTIYVIETSFFGWKVNRVFKDFQWLYKCLNGRYPASYVATC